jgi:glutaredoxin 3
MVTIYTKQGCAYSAGAKRLLDEKAIAYEEIDVTVSAQRRDEMIRRAGGAKTTPQIFFGDRHVGGYTELQELDRTEGLWRAMNEEGEGAAS